MMVSRPCKEPNSIRVLIVEDNPGEWELLREYLCHRDVSFTPKVWEASDLGAALRLLDHFPIDVVVLDLNLPDCGSLKTFFRIRDHHPEVAVVVMTGLDDESLGLEAIRNQAQYYLPKSRLDEFTLGRVVHYAHERKRLYQGLELLRLQQSKHQEMLQLENYSRDNFSEGGRIFSLLPSYSALVRHYIFATREGNARPSVVVQALAQRLVLMGARARDIVRLHLKMLAETGNWTTATEERTFSVDARLVLVELLGTLVDLYRDISLSKGESP